ncbi:phage tail assembly protein [Paenibacillus sp. TAB 01]|uniref:phage tail assembly protein n=1 Tax=Paenibacillus sp. TAB 01 TaxID=3368988 RepID=UPI003750D5BE
MEMNDDNVAIYEAGEDPVFKLSRSLVFEGDTVTELDLDLESLTSDDLLAAERQLTIHNKGNPTPVLEISKLYLAMVAARAAKVPFELIKSLPARDFSKITIRVQNFLLG